MDHRGPNSQQNSGQNHQTNGTGSQAQNGDTTPNQHASEITAESPEYCQIFLERLLSVVSNGQPEIVDQLITTIRSGASQQEIFAALSASMTDDSPSDPGNKTQAS
ncbi:hypothetical protein ARAM_006838 [Aspergillus rambellii]|uniref:Uncharacterized protein n=1 Tax=Aspergillus rambellii TaxID=308745 RepID=A0A0F8V233_9EURO|nr:hypothetical protein ARAM_006838 [Aspergillus rambellii]